MSTIMKSLAMSVVAIGMSFATATPASATPACNIDRVTTCVTTIIDIGGGNTGGSCNGSVDTNCSYCAYNASNVASPNTFCDNNWSGYSYETCGTWVAAQCVIG